ncbi:MAG: hypothetical protein NG740_03185 [Omnitrophica bacterium]|nr:hypothetical protein [Candidatus Omnitrophota bacterium]
MINVQTLKVDESWSFAEVKRSETMYASHGYHKYPAKFIPQIVQRLMRQYSVPGDVVLDPFGGCGTTLIESKINGRIGISIDVNRVAGLITKAKMNAICPKLLGYSNKELLKRIKSYKDRKNYYRQAHLRLKYWFKWHHYNKLQLIYNCIRQEKNSIIQNFYLCCFSNILKNCSIWYSKSIKPMRDLEKKIEQPLVVFKRHLNYMTKMNEQYFRLLNSKGNIFENCKVLKGDARNLNLKNNSIDLIITSPPYVTSYEYADLHQLSTLWFGYTDDLTKIKKSFIGTSSRLRSRKNISSEMANQTVKAFLKKQKKLAKSIGNYYVDLEKCFREIHRILRTNKYLCLILGDTEYSKIKVPNTKVSIQIMQSIGFTVESVIKRRLSSKIFTPFRDKMGRFTDSSHNSKRNIYQYEYIVIAKK